MGLFDNRKINDYKARCQMQIGELDECANGCSNVKAYAAVNNVSKVFKSKQNKPYVFDKKALDDLFATVGTLISDIRTAVAKKHEEAISGYAGILAMFLQLNMTPKNNGDALSVEKLNKYRDAVRYKSSLTELLKARDAAEKTVETLAKQKADLDAKCAKLLAIAKSGTLSEEELAVKKREYLRLKEDAESLQSDIDLKDRTLANLRKEIAFAKDAIAILDELETIIETISAEQMSVEDFEAAYRRYAEAEEKIHTRSDVREDIKNAYRGAGNTKRNADADEFDAAVAQGKKNKSADDAFRYDQYKN